MQFLILFLVAVGIFVICGNFCLCESNGPIHEKDDLFMPIRPKIFSTPEELKSYLEELGNFYAIASRPRFGKRAMGLWAMSYLRNNPAILKN